MPDIYVGLLSGTSMDGIDAVAVHFQNNTPHVLAHHDVPYPAPLHDSLKQLAQGTPLPIAHFAMLDAQSGILLADAVRQLLVSANLMPQQIRAIGSHGQTVWHISEGDVRTSVQIGDPNILAERTGITTVADFRRRDIAAGGQGAPLVPAFHAACWQSNKESRVVVNIGGIANITVLPTDQHAPVIGFDTGPGNTLLDFWIREQQQHAYDHDGRFARSGRILPEVLETLLADPYFKRPPPKSTGPEYFNRTWLQNRLGDLSRYPAADMQATLTALTAQSIAQAIQQHAVESQRVLVCGGGAYNLVLMEHLQTALDPRTVDATADYGLAPNWVEAVAFAWLAKQTLDHKPGNLPTVTGAKHPVILGAVYFV